MAESHCESLPSPFDECSFPSITRSSKLKRFRFTWGPISSSPTDLLGLLYKCFFSCLLKLHCLTAHNNWSLSSCCMLCCCSLPLCRAMVQLLRTAQLLPKHDHVANRSSLLENVKQAISSSARRFSGHQQHVCIHTTAFQVFLVGKVSADTINDSQCCISAVLIATPHAKT